MTCMGYPLAAPFFFSGALSTPPLPQDESVFSRDQSISPFIYLSIYLSLPLSRYAPGSLISRVGSVILYRVDCRQTDFNSYSPPSAFNDKHQFFISFYQESIQARLQDFALAPF